MLHIQRIYGRISAVFQPYVSRISALCQPGNGRMSASCQPYVRRMSTACQPHVRRISAICQLSVSRGKALCPPYVSRKSSVYPSYIHRISAIPNLPINWRALVTYPRQAESWTAEINLVAVSISALFSFKCINRSKSYDELTKVASTGPDYTV